MADLSPAAREILIAYWEAEEKAQQQGVAAALQTAAEEIEALYCDSDVEDSPGIVFALRQLMLIADELGKDDG